MHYFLHFSIHESDFTITQTVLILQLNCGGLRLPDPQRELCPPCTSAGGIAPRLEVCMGMGKTGIPWVPWDSHGNGS